jgi:hypothetical protein
MEKELKGAGLFDEEGPVADDFLEIHRDVQLQLHILQC